MKSILLTIGILFMAGWALLNHFDKKLRELELQTEAQQHIDWAIRIEQHDRWGWRNPYEHNQLVLGMHWMFFDYEKELKPRYKELL